MIQLVLYCIAIVLLVLAAFRVLADRVSLALIAAAVALLAYIQPALAAHM